MAFLNARLFPYAFGIPLICLDLETLITSSVIEHMHLSRTYSLTSKSFGQSNSADEFITTANFTILFGTQQQQVLSDPSTRVPPFARALAQDSAPRACPGGSTLHICQPLPVTAGPNQSQVDPPDYALFFHRDCRTCWTLSTSPCFVISC